MRRSRAVPFRSGRRSTRWSAGRRSSSTVRAVRIIPISREFVYELDYGYLKGTTSADGEGIDVWIGSDPRRQVTGALCTVDLVKHDAELKILVGCTAGDCAVIRRFYRTPLSAVRILRRKKP